MGENKVIDVINRLTSPDIIGTIFGCKRNGDPRSIFDIIKSVDKIAAKKKKKNKELYEALMNDKKTISQRDVEKFYKNKKKNGKKGKGKKLSGFSGNGKKRVFPKQVSVQKQGSVCLSYADNSQIIPYDQKPLHQPPADVGPSGTVP